MSRWWVTAAPVPDVRVRLCSPAVRSSPYSGSLRSVFCPFLLRHSPFVSLLQLSVDSATSPSNCSNEVVHSSRLFLSFLTSLSNAIKRTSVAYNRCDLLRSLVLFPPLRPKSSPPQIRPPDLLASRSLRPCSFLPNSPSLSSSSLVS